MASWSGSKQKISATPGEKPARSSQSVINFLEEKKIKREQQREQAQQEQAQRQQKKEIRDFFIARRAPLQNINREWRDFFKNQNPEKFKLWNEIKKEQGIPNIKNKPRNYDRNLNETPESISHAVAVKTELLSILKKEWEAIGRLEEAVKEATKEAERQRIRERNEQQIRDKEEELARLRVSLRPRVEEDIEKMIKSGHLPSSIPLTGNKVYDEIFAELIQPHVEQFQKEKSRKGVQEAYEYISRRQKDGIKHLGQWTGSEITPTEEEILERLKTAINGGNGFESDISKKIFNEYLKASNHSGGRRKTRRGRKHRRRSTRRKQ
jgi:hypothetical protein